MNIEKINQYIAKWKQCGYSDDIPDEVPDILMRLNLAPSYKAIAIAILKNDHALKGLGFTGEESQWYRVLKRIEISQRNNGYGETQDLFK